MICEFFFYTADVIQGGWVGLKDNVSLTLSVAVLAWTSPLRASLETFSLRDARLSLYLFLFTRSY